jgi:hypothetical protein
VKITIKVVEDCPLGTEYKIHLGLRETDLSDRKHPIRFARKMIKKMMKKVRFAAKRIKNKHPLRMKRVEELEEVV